MPGLQTTIQTIKRNRAITGEFSWIVLGAVASVLGALVGVRLLTEVLDPSTYGELALAMTAATLLNQTILGPLSNAYSRFFAPAREVGELGSYLRGVAGLTVMGAAIAGAAGIVGVCGAWWLGYTNWIPLLGATLVFALVSGCNSIMDGLQNAARHRAVVALHQALASWLRFSCAVLLVALTVPVSSVAMWGYCLGSLVVFVSQAWFFKSQIVEAVTDATARRTRESTPWRNRMWRYTWPFSTWGIVTWLQLASDRWALQAFCSTTDVGLYAVVFQLGYYPLMLISGVVSQFIAPLFFEMAGDGTDKVRGALVTRRSRVITIAALGVSLCCVLAAALLHDWVFRLLTGTEYQTASWLLPAVAVSGGLFGTAQLAVTGLLSNHGSGVLLKPKLSIAALGIVLNFWFASLWGLIGVVSAGILINAVYLVWVILLNERSQRDSPITTSWSVLRWLSY